MTLKKTCILLTVTCLLCGLSGNPSFAADGVAVGDPAPQFSAKDDQGKTWKSEDHVGKKILVVYFYPADLTGGCTKQACAFRDDLPKFTEQGVEVIGVSGDTVENHQLFKKAHDLNFTLLADIEGTVAKAFGVPSREGGSIQRTVDNKEYTLTRALTTARWTFVIDKSGKVVHKNTSVNAAEDSQAVMQVLKSLK
ncbi:MAG: peroxiredoxin [Planctomycetaceae bacterium]|nr:peroxiredoxin [Planctomycetaceae bacterium]